MATVIKGPNSEVLTPDQQLERAAKAIKQEAESQLRVDARVGGPAHLYNHGALHGAGNVKNGSVWAPPEVLPPKSGYYLVAYSDSMDSIRSAWYSHDKRLWEVQKKFLYWTHVEALPKAPELPV